MTPEQLEEAIRQSKALTDATLPVARKMVELLMVELLEYPRHGQLKWAMDIVNCFDQLKELFEGKGVERETDIPETSTTHQRFIQAQRCMEADGSGWVYCPRAKATNT